MPYKDDLLLCEEEMLSYFFKEVNRMDEQKDNKITATTIAAKTLQYEDIKKGKRFRIYPSRRGTKKQTDPEQLRIFMARQKRLSELWRKMGIVSWKVIENTDKKEDLN